MIERRGYNWKDYINFMNRLESDSLHPWPTLVQPEYQYFQHLYNLHLARAKDYRDQRSEYFTSHGYDVETINFNMGHSSKFQEGQEKNALIAATSNLTGNMEEEASKAFNILLIMQLTYRNLIVEQKQSNLLWYDTYGDGTHYKFDNLRRNGTPAANLLDDDFDWGFSHS